MTNEEFEAEFGPEMYDTDYEAEYDDFDDFSDGDDDFGNFVDGDDLLALSDLFSSMMKPEDAPLSMKTEMGEYLVSTIEKSPFLVMLSKLAGMPGAESPFETAVFHIDARERVEKGDYSRVNPLFMQSHETRSAAEDGHNVVVARINAGEMEFDA